MHKHLLMQRGHRDAFEALFCPLLPAGENLEQGRPEKKNLYVQISCNCYLRVEQPGIARLLTWTVE
jgi:hypothetical protein